MAILNDIKDLNKGKYALVQPVVKSILGKSSFRKSRIVHSHATDSSVVIDYLMTFVDVVYAMCIAQHNYGVRVYPNHYELRGQYSKNSQYLYPKDINIVSCSKTQPKSDEYQEFVFDEVLFDSYIECKPIQNPNYVIKQDHWVIQVLKGQWDATPNQEVHATQNQELPNQSQPPNLTFLDSMDSFSSEALSQKLFGQYQPCDISSIQISKNVLVSFDIQVVQYLDGQKIYSYIPVPPNIITKEEYDYLNELIVFKDLNRNNNIAVSNDTFIQIEFVDDSYEVDDDTNPNIDLDELPTLDVTIEDGIEVDNIDNIVDEYDQLPISIDDFTDFDDDSSESSDIEVKSRNDMAVKYFGNYQPCLINSIEYSDLTGSLYTIKLINEDGMQTIHIPTYLVRERDRNFFTEFINNLSKLRFVRVFCDKIEFNSSYDVKFFTEHYREPQKVEDINNISINTTIQEPTSIPEVIKKPITYRQLELVFITNYSIDDEEDIQLEPIPIVPSFKVQVRKFFVATFKDAPQFTKLTFALQNDGRSVVLHYQSLTHGKRILYGTAITDFDIGIQELLVKIVNKYIEFFNLNNVLWAKTYCKKTQKYITKRFIDLS